MLFGAVMFNQFRLHSALIAVEWDDASDQVTLGKHRESSWHCVYWVAENKAPRRKLILSILSKMLFPVLNELFKFYFKKLFFK